MRLALTTPIRFEGQAGIIVGHCYANGDLYDLRLSNGQTRLYVRPERLMVVGKPMPADQIKKIEDIQ